jgi:hypothetical protein
MKMTRYTAYVSVITVSIHCQLSAVIDPVIDDADSISGSHASKEKGC